MVKGRVARSYKKLGGLYRELQELESDIGPKTREGDTNCMNWRKFQPPMNREGYGWEEQKSEIPSFETRREKTEGDAMILPDADRDGGGLQKEKLEQIGSLDTVCSKSHALP